ncbi:hypothetical protein SAMN04487891_109171 [Flagellimonas taeanensis]|uniref:Chaperone of endosialidase n=1 Tax=Flagellimonas taeanensis TaxID=1005926 RepID=A0A1M7AU78_9FLAO|nr:tail fiber protein [Allomuricauda taeanensis]SFC36080.1 hypothetical protein SAMN04487891_109171 [Allomuricauda taeanensis]SHL46293.1 hypothetical protein SAMN05216293_3544 [Allomuricauda taeanensis]
MKAIIFLFAGFCWQFSVAQNDLYIDNAKYLYAKTSSGINTRTLGINSSNNLYLGSVDASINSLLVNLNGNNRITVNGTSGFVGIGTTSPDEILHLEGSLLLDAYGQGTERGIFFREGFSASNKYNLSITTYDDGDNTPDALGINAYDGIYFNTGSSSINTRMYIHQNGRVGIGTTNPDAQLTVKGKIHAEEVKVDLSVPGPDYVFKEGYDLKSLEEVKNYIKEHGHLPNIPSAKEMEANGIQLGEMNMKLLEKIEELTLYIIRQEYRLKETEGLKQELEKQREEIRELKKINKMTPK